MRYIKLSQTLGKDLTFLQSVEQSDAFEMHVQSRIGNGPRESGRIALSRYMLGAISSNTRLPLNPAI